MADRPPAAVDRGALERIIQRAAELQAADREFGDTLTHDEILALGREVGIPPAYLQQAILEERSRLAAPAPAGLLDQAIGPREVGCQRIVPGEVAEVERALLKWMDTHELLAVQRHVPGRITWERLGGMAGGLRRIGAAFESRPFMLSRATTVTATLTPLDTGQTLVRLTADVRETRAGTVAGAVALGSVGLAAAGVLLVLGAFPLAAVAPPVIGGALGAVAVREYRKVVERLTLGLERALDHLEQHRTRPGQQAVRPGLLELLGEELRKSLTPPTRP